MVTHADGGETAEAMFELPFGAAAPAVGREHVAAHGAGCDAELLADALVVVSELVTNAVTHGSPAVWLQVAVSASRLKIRVTDAGVGLPVSPQGLPPENRLGGRGLLLVAALTSEWGVEAAQPPPGKTVWCELTGLAADPPAAN